MLLGLLTFVTISLDYSLSRDKHRTHRSLIMFKLLVWAVRITNSTFNSVTRPLFLDDTPRAPYLQKRMNFFF